MISLLTAASLGHRVATQYLLSALEGHLPAAHLLHYRAANSKLPGHPELGLTPGVKFSSGRLGHMWSLVNGVALANKDKTIFMLGSDGSQQEGDDAEDGRRHGEQVRLRRVEAEVAKRQREVGLRRGDGDW